MRKKIAIAAAIAIIIIAASSMGMAAESIKIIVNGQTLNSGNDAMIVNGRIFLPLRQISESLGLEVKWDEESRTVNISSKDTVRTGGLIKLNGEQTTWPCWFAENELYLEQRNCLELIRTKYEAPWHLVYLRMGPDNKYATVTIDQKSSRIRTKEFDGYAAVSLDSLAQFYILEYEWQPENNNLTIR